MQSTDIEIKHVHEIYDQIGHHFSETRYKPWPRIDAFLKACAPGELVADVGCGNGKYFGSVPPHAFMIGSDRSRVLTDICGGRGFEALVADSIKLPLRSNAFDTVISIAVVHHFSTEQHRRQALAELFRIARPKGRVLVYVWAFEQQEGSRMKWTEQDNLVPWHLQARFQRQRGRPASPGPGGEGEAGEAGAGAGEVVLRRFYHVFRKGELEALVESLGTARLLESGYDKENWWLVAERI
eukprot:tig00000383_g24708.t1